ncbi:MAG TPA: murein biosynthesis integral membrane protein MurJ [Mycobacterium sp.]|nr:murein biosynthesis integral membrane protein MurJ [Mycobacterium sp.]
MTGPARRPARPELSDAAVVSRSWGMALATLVSRLTGFIRIVLLAAILGAALSSAFSVANQLPNLIAALVLEATFTAIFVPVLARAERDDPDGGAAFVRRLVTLATTLLLIATVASVVAAPLLVRMMLGDDPKVNSALTTAFAYLLLPQVIFYGLTSVFMAILNNRNIFGPPAWAPVLNNIVAIGTLVLYLLVPGELSVDPVQMGNAKLLVLGIGTTLGVIAQAVVLLLAIRAERISLRPLWGIDDRLRRFGMMAAAMVLYVLISQVGLVVGNQIASTAAASGPAIYYYAWLVLQLPFGMIGVTILTVVMPRLSRNAAADDTPAVRADLSLATRLTMVTLIPIVAFMTVAGPPIGSALFAYGNFGEVDANYLGIAIAMSSFTLIPYALVLLQLRVFYAREQPWTPIVIIVAITTVKIAASLAAPHLTDNLELVAAYLGAANGLGFVAGALLGHVLLRRSLRPPGGRLLSPEVLRTVAGTTAASVLAALVAAGVDRMLHLEALTTRSGGAGSMVRLLILGIVMAPIIIGLSLAARVPDVRAAVTAVARRMARITEPGPNATDATESDSLLPDRATPVTYSERGISFHGKGPELSDEPSGTPSGDDPAPRGPRSADPAPRPRSAADDFHPDVPAGSADFAEPPTTARYDSESARRYAATPADTPLVPGASISGGRYRLLVFHGGPPGLQFWQALDTALDRQVALTFVDPDHRMTEDEVQTILQRTLALSRIDRPGLARVLDVTTTNTGGLVVAEWIRGGSVKEVAETAPSAIGAARAIQSLAAAAEEAHHAGVVLSIDHPSRIRVSIDGDVALAFPGTLPDATPTGDIRGIGAALYALLVDRWPLPEAGYPSGLVPAETGANGEPVEPAKLDGDIPFQISAAAARAVQSRGGISSAPTLLNLLHQATAAAERTDLVEPVAPVLPDDALRRPAREPLDEGEQRTRRRRNVLIGVGLGAAVLVAALVVLASVLSRIFGDTDGGLKGDRLGLNTTTSTSSAAPGSAVKPVAVTVFSPDGGADAPDLAGLAIDGDPSTAWPTDTYTDSVPFPNFKSGVGLMLQLPQPTEVGAVTVSVSSTGTQVQIRSADSASPSSLADTTLLTGPTTLKQGSNTISVPAAEPTSYLLVWISTMGQTGGKNRTEVSEITVSAAS